MASPASASFASCDKELPCGRCQNSGNGRECYYSYNKGPNGGRFPCPTAAVVPTGESAKASAATWHVQHKVRGSSHWRDLMTKIGTLTPLDSPPLASALENIATNACLANFTLPGNFPFGTPGATKYYSRDAIIKLLECERENFTIYIDRYLNLLDCVNPILDLDVFKREVDQYWVDPNAVDLCWLSQLLMVLGLGCFATVEEPHQATELMMAAEACLMQTPFMFRPTLLTLKALSLMVVAKQVCNATCWSVDSCWSLLGLLVRLAFIYGLPQERTESGDQILDPVERDKRRKLWLTILYLDIKVAMCTGMPPLTSPDELGGLKDLPEWGEPDCLQMVLWQSIPTVLDVLGLINSKKEQISYPEVLRYNTRLRELMAHAQRVCSGQLQRITVDIFLRRCLMVLHRPFALHPDGPVLFPESYWSSLECSLALLIHYRELWCTDNNQRLDLVGRAFVLDFFSAALTAFVHVLSILKNSYQKSPPTSPPPTTDKEITIANTQINAGHRRTSSAARPAGSSRRQSAHSSAGDDLTESSQRLKWDEANLYLTEQERSSTMKITEPKTPYAKHYDPNEDPSDDEGPLDQSGHSRKGPRPGAEDDIPGLSLGEPEEEVPEGFTPSRSGSEKSVHVEEDIGSGHNAEDEMANMSPEEREKHLKFERLRKKHYEMKNVAQLLGHPEELPEDEEEDDGTGAIPPMPRAPNGSA
ncbi:hypothetical protein G7046_g4753 [Stylonectria norvegica]|nr:hypothetical protein G7046_g4753 [Stylonectria norvegica]